jgi:hypothetical protein
MLMISIGGARYFVTLLDDFSKVSVVQCISRKAGIPQIVSAVITLIETQSGRRVQRVCSDREGEFVNRFLEKLYRDKGIDRELRQDSSKSNGAAEREHRTIMDRACAMLLDASLPIELWGEAVTTACYLRNRSPASAAHD